MNICAVRTLKGDIWNDAASILYKSGQPHEPKSEQRLVMKPVTDNKIDSLQWQGDYAECKHCGAIYAEMEAVETEKKERRCELGRGFNYPRGNSAGNACRLVY